MKKIISMFLACLLAASCLIIAPVAEGATDTATVNQSGFIQVDYVSDHTGDTATYKTVFQERYKTAVLTETPTAAGSVDIRGQFKAASTVSKIRVFTTAAYSDNVSVSLSVDGVNWTYTTDTYLSTKTTPLSATNIYYDFYVNSTEAYQYVKVSNKTTDAFGVIYVSLYAGDHVFPKILNTGADSASDTSFDTTYTDRTGTTVTVAGYQTAAFQSGYSFSTYGTRLFTDYNTNTKNDDAYNSKSVAGTDANDDAIQTWSVVARFDVPTVITGAMLTARNHSVGNRMDGIVIQATTYDGYDLTEIGTGENPGWETITDAVSDISTANLWAYLSTTSTKAYTYVRAYKEVSGSTQFSMSIDGISLTGYETTPVVSYTQYSTPDENDNVQNIRILGTVNARNHAEIGYNVTVSWKEGNETVTKELGDVKCEYLYFSINAKEGGDMVSKTASDLGGNYIFALTLKNVPTNKGEITIKATPYIKHTASSEPVYGTTGTAVYNNGAPVTAEV